MKITNPTIVFFDFDGTITRKDSMVEFIKYAVGPVRYYLGIVRSLPMLVLYKLKVIPNQKAKEKFISHYFEGFGIDKFRDVASEYSMTQINKIVKPSALSKIKWHKEKGHRVVVVSASLECWLKKWCECNEVDLISTQLECEDGVLTGKFLSLNCYGQEKVNRIKEKYTLTDYSDIYAYGDSRGDKEMLSIASHSFYQVFKG